VHALKSPDETAEKGRRNAVRVESVFSWAPSAEKIENIYRSLLPNPDIS
jgi:hypothetical protein